MTYWKQTNTMPTKLIIRNTKMKIDIDRTVKLNRRQEKSKTKDGKPDRATKARTSR